VVPTNVEIVRRVIDAISRGDIDAASGLVSADLEADLSNSRGPLSGVYRGREPIRRFLRSFLDAWASLEWEPDELIEIGGDGVLTVSRLRMRGQESGVEVNAGGAAIWTVRDGEVAVVRLYQSKADALEAAGLT
jgi:ketosteroid isomerase-like protein